MRYVRSIWKGVVEADRFVRLHFLVFSGVWPLMGAVSVRPALGARQIATLLGATLCFHCFAMVLNDVIDLPIDRREPRRQNDPLVRGAVRPWQALLFALAQPILTIPLTMMLGGGSLAYTALAVGFAAMAAYDLWGKRCPFPPLTDALQGIGWGSLAVYAACAGGATPTALTWLVAAYVTGFTLLFNGIHGPLRDLENDLANGAKTTALLLGARPKAGRGTPVVPAAVAAYGWTVLAILLAIHATIVIRNDFGYGRWTWTLTAAMAVAINAWIVALHVTVLRPDSHTWQSAFRLQLYVITISLPLAFIAYAGIGFALTLLMLTALSLSLFEVTPAVARWLWRSATAALPREYNAGRPAATLNGVDDTDAPR